ncbi:MAG: hypothetical protein ABR981_04355 [Candidatus Micrarchaeaceae archaeon]|jgi:dihydroorotase
MVTTEKASTLEKPNTKHIDVHVHCRDWGETHKATIREVMQLARSQGIVAIGDMPNTKMTVEQLLGLPEMKNYPTHFIQKLIQQVMGFKGGIVTSELVDLRLKTAEREGSLDGYYLHIGATKYELQIVEAAKVATENPRVLGIKDFYGKSTNNLSILEMDEQKHMFQILTREGYGGVVTLHCEKEELARPGLWNPRIPASWNEAKPPIMELFGVLDIIQIVRETGFKGHVHIAHISTPQSVEFVYEAKKSGMRISCGTTPHHNTFSTEDMQSPEGMKYKVNPPIRYKYMMLELRQQLRDGKIDIIETDNAPHTPQEKTYDPSKPNEFFMSGIRSLDNYSTFIQGLFSEGVTTEQIEKLTYLNVKKIFPKIVQ